MKRLVRYLLPCCVVAVIALLLAWAFSEVRRNRQMTTCTGLDVVFRDDARFVTEEDVLELLARHYGIYTGQRIDSVDLRRIERLLATRSAVRKGEAWTTDDGILHVSIEQREPVMRIQTDSGALYADDEGILFPIRGSAAPLVPVVDGAVQPSDRAWVSGLLGLVRFMHRSRVWEENSAQISALPSGELVLIPRSGRERFLFGRPDAVREKFARIEKYYRYIQPAQEGAGYGSVNVKYNGQIVCRK